MLTDLHTHRVVSSNYRAVYNIRVTDVAVEVPDHISAFSAGVHPWDAGCLWQPETLDRLLADRRCLAVGEIGLDRLAGPSLGQQQAAFERQMELAGRRRRPVIVHAVRTQSEVISILRKFPAAGPVVVHGFSQRADTARRWLDAGCFLSFGASLVKGSRAVTESLRVTPLNRLFLETDDSGVTLDTIYMAAAAALNLPVQVLSDQIYNNYLTVFFDGKLA